MFTVDAIDQLCRHLPAPRRRPLHEIAEPRLAATAVPVVDLDGEAAVVITRRPATMTYHRGDWVFPGGRVDVECDATSADAARRELSEELGVTGQIVGQLDTHGPIVTGFLIDVYVVVVRGAILRPDAREVSAVATVALEHFLAPGNLAFDRPWPTFDAGPRAVDEPGESSDVVSPARDLPSFVLPNGDLVWGTQGEILANFLQQLTRLRALGLG